MDCLNRSIKVLRQPSPKSGGRRHVRIYAKTARRMLSPSSQYTKRVDRPSRSNTRSRSPRYDLPRLSDVPCYTCRRRHVKCDMILPHCAKCAKKGVTCLGYRKPLRWADGVAVRGKLKGKSEPVLDSQAVSSARNTLQEASNSIRQEVVHFGLHATDNCCSDVTTNDLSFSELVNYHNSNICVEHHGSELSQIVVRRIALLSPEVVRRLPRDILNCIVGSSAVHMAVHNLGNRAIEQLALETKVSLYQSMNRLFQNPREKRSDVLFCCIRLMFAMDVIEYGSSRWSVHFTGALKLLFSSGGMDNFAVHYPHLKITLAQTLLFETMHVLLLPVSLEGSKQASRRAVESICYDPSVRKHHFITCPLRLMLSIYDMGACAQNIFRAQGCPSTADVYKREWILSDVLHFQPEEGVHNVIESYYTHRTLTALELQAWDLVFTAWKHSITIVVLRHLYFGLPNPDNPTNLSRSPTPSIGELGLVPSYNEQSSIFQESDGINARYSFEGLLDPNFVFDRLSPSLLLTESLSRTPSPLPSSRPSTRGITLDYWDRRYDIHDEAFVELTSSLVAIGENPDPSYLRYVLTPLQILGLVSRRNSPERASCLNLCDRFKKYLIDMRASEVNLGFASPIGGPELEFDSPWDKLDAFSEEAVRDWQNCTGLTESQLRNSAPEWNWWYMLKRVELETMWPLTAGTMHMEFGTEFWPLNTLSGLVSDDCFAAFMRPPVSFQQSSST